MNKKVLSMKGIIIITILSLTTTLTTTMTHAKECTALDVYKKAYEKLLIEQKAVQEKMAPLVKKMDISTTDLIEQGTAYLRDFKKKMNGICQEQEILKQMDCTTMDVETLKTNASDSCRERAKYLLQIEQQKFEQNMIYDAGQKKFQFIVNKLQDINKKFRYLIMLFGMIQGELSKLFDNEGKYATSNHAGAGSS